MADNEKIISKIKKVLELSKNNPSEEEALAAALKAQKMMAEYHLSLEDVEGIENDDDITEIHVNVGTGNKWKSLLASAVSKNFCCKYFYYGRDTIAFFGYKTDAEIAAETFKFLFSFGNKKATQFYNKHKSEYGGKGLKNTYLLAFVDGVREVFERQCTALMIVTPLAVEDKYKKRVEGCTTRTNSFRTRGDDIGDLAREEGRRTGKEAARGRSIEQKEVM